MAYHEKPTKVCNGCGNEKCTCNTARIIGQNHDVTPYEVNGRKRYIIEAIPISNYRTIVNDVVSVVGRDWAKVTNYLDSRIGKYFTIGDNGYTIQSMTPGLIKTIERMTY